MPVFVPFHTVQEKDLMLGGGRRDRDTADGRDNYGATEQRDLCWWPDCGKPRLGKPVGENLKKGFRDCVCGLPLLFLSPGPHEDQVL